MPLRYIYCNIKMLEQMLTDHQHKVKQNHFNLSLQKTIYLQALCLEFSE
jgi:hypothetical protein